MKNKIIFKILFVWILSCIFYVLISDKFQNTITLNQLNITDTSNSVMFLLFIFKFYWIVPVFITVVLIIKYFMKKEGKYL